MKIVINYGNGVITLPKTAVKVAAKATKSDLLVLLFIFAEPRAQIDFDACADDIAAAAGVTKEQFKLSLAFWRGAGVIESRDAAEDEEKKAAHHKAQNSMTASERAKVASGDIESDLNAEGSSCADEAEKDNIDEKGTEKSKEKVRKKLRPKNSLPEYTSDDVKAAFERLPDLGELIDACQQTMGRMFNNAEAAIIVGLHDYLGLDYEYILMLLAWCVKRGKKALKYAERTAFSLYDRGVDTPAALDAHIKWMEEQEKLEGRLRGLLGIGSRAFSARERQAFERWSREWGMNYDMIERAYMVTVDAIGNVSVPYMNKVLESWHERGFKSVLEIDEAEAKYRASKEKDAGNSGGSFDTDEFFQLAVKRGLKESGTG